ncbi:hypothetical protein M1555_04875 [Patescibacteria group bacterium]|nr:hypothetical protein [Patescibacteria group bacterium]
MEETEFRGRAMADELTLLSQRLNFPYQLIAQHGALAIDVGDGPDMIALAPMNPSVLIVSEPYTEMGNDYVAPEPLHTTVLNTLAQAAHATLLRMDASDAINYLQRTCMRVALITRLNMFPEPISFTEISMALELLIPDGLLLMSWDSEAYKYEIMDYTEKKLGSYRTDIITPPDDSPLTAGGVFLAVWPKS